MLVKSGREIVGLQEKSIDWVTPLSLHFTKQYSTHIDSEVLQTFELAQALLQLGVDLQGLGFGVFEEGPELLQSVKLAWGHKTEKEQS